MEMGVGSDSLRRWVDRWYRERERGWEAPAPERVSEFIQAIAGRISDGDISSGRDLWNLAVTLGLVYPTYPSFYLEFLEDERRHPELEPVRRADRFAQYLQARGMGPNPCLRCGSRMAGGVLAQ